MANMYNGEHVNEVLQAQAHVWNHIFNFINSMSLRCAIDLGIPDIIQNHGKPMTVTELVVALPTLGPSKVCNIYRLMRILVHSGFFERRKLGNDAQEQGYVLTNASRLLLKNNPFSLAPYLKVITDPILMSPWHFLGTWFRNDDHTPFVSAHGKTFWDYVSHAPRLSNLFNESMANDAPLITSVLVDECKCTFEGIGSSLVDVGGGTGTLAKAIADAYPRLECIVFDLPHVVDGLQGRDNLKYVGGNMFEAIPAADAVLLKWIFHNWNDEDCLRILKRCKEAISGRGNVGGRVIIIDIVVTEDEETDDESSKSIETQLFFDMLMMVVVDGKERREEEWAKLFSTAGFSDYKISRVIGLRSLIEVYP